MSLLLHSDSPREPVKAVNMHDFAVSFSRDAQYIAIRTSTQNQVAANRLEAFLIAEQEAWQTIATLWNAMIAAVPNFQPSANDIERWNALIDQHNIPFHFNDDETLSLDTPEP